MVKTQVVFTPVNAFVLVNNKRGIKDDYLVLTNPKIDVGTVSSRYWKIGRNNSVVVMSDEEKKNRDLDIDQLGEHFSSDIFVAELQKGAPSSKPLILQEIKNTPVLHIETKEIRHLDIKPIGSLKVDTVKLDKIEVLPISVNKIEIDPIEIKPIQVIFPKSLEVMELLNTLIMFSLLMYVLFRK